MCSVSHVAAGAIIGSLLDTSLISFLAGVASHVPMDLAPHFDFEDFRIDAAVSAGLLGAVALVLGFSPVLAGALGAVAPDLENLLWKTGLIDEKRKVFPTHSGLIPHGKAKGDRGYRGVIAVSALSAAIVAIAVMIGGSR